MREKSNYNLITLITTPPHRGTGRPDRSVPKGQSVSPFTVFCTPPSASLSPLRPSVGQSPLVNRGGGAEGGTGPPRTSGVGVGARGVPSVDTGSSSSSSTSADLRVPRGPRGLG